MGLYTVIPDAAIGVARDLVQRVFLVARLDIYSAYKGVDNVITVILIASKNFEGGRNFIRFLKTLLLAM